MSQSEIRDREPSQGRPTHNECTSSISADSTHINWSTDGTSYAQARPSFGTPADVGGTRRMTPY